MTEFGGSGEFSYRDVDVEGTDYGDRDELVFEDETRKVTWPDAGLSLFAAKPRSIFHVEIRQGEEICSISTVDSPFQQIVITSDGSGDDDRQVSFQLDLTSEQVAECDFATEPLSAVIELTEQVTTASPKTCEKA